MSDMSINLSMGGSFYRASQNSEKVNRAINQMLNRLETGNKYQYAYQNVSAVTEGASLKANIATQETAASQGSKYQQQLDPVMQAQTEILDILGQMKEVASKFSANSTGTDASALQAQYSELATTANELAGSVSFNSKSLKDGLAGDISFGNITHAISSTAINLGTTLGANSGSDVDTAISNLTSDSAKLGVVYNNLIDGAKNIMSSDINAMTQRYTSLLTADDNETSALISSLNSRMNSINAARQYAAASASNSISLANLII